MTLFTDLGLRPELLAALGALGALLISIGLGLIIGACLRWCGRDDPPEPEDYPLPSGSIDRVRQ